MKSFLLLTLFLSTRLRPCLSFAAPRMIQERQSAYGLTSRAAVMDPQSAAELTVAASVGLAPVIGDAWNSNGTQPSSSHEEEEKMEDEEEELVVPPSTLTGCAVNNLSAAARIYAVLLLSDLFIQRFFPSSGFPLLREPAPIVAVTVWGALTLSELKNVVFRRAVSGNKLNRVSLYDRLIDFIIFIVTSLVILEELNVDVGMGFQSLFAAGGIGALVIGLASKDLAENIVSGLIVQSWGAFDIGDVIRLGDGTEGTVKKVGLVDTEIAGYDGWVTTIPNSDLTTKRVCNLSRIERCRIRQVLRFKATEVTRLPDTLNLIKEEIRSTCPRLLKDGSNPMRAVMTEYENDQVRVVVDCYFNVSPSSNLFLIVQQEMVLAIARAIEASDDLEKNPDPPSNTE